MATTLRIHIIITFILASAAVALIVTSLATPTWIIASLKSVTLLPNVWLNDVNYGLFSGHISGLRGIKVNGDLTMSCDMSANICIMSCQTDENFREQELDSLMHSGARRGCPFATSENGTCNGHCSEFINAGIWVSCVIFLSLALLGAVLAAVFAVVNSTISPIEPVLSVPGLYIWNGAGAICSSLVLILWGALYADTLQYNIAYSETVTGQYTSEATLGVSYWLLIVSSLLMIGNICILLVRKYQLAREPPPSTVKMEENTDGIIFLY